MGGRVPYGYRLIDTTIHGVRTSMYVQEPEEAENIRIMYEMYQDPNVSYGDIMRYFDTHNILYRGRKFNRIGVSTYLSNPVYVMADQSVFEFYQNQGIRIINDESDFVGTNGCYYYTGQNISRNPNENSAYIVIAPHMGIVPADVWLNCLVKHLQNKEIQPARKVTNSWLAGKVKCGVCGYALTRKWFKGHLYSYFYCSRKRNAGDCVGCGKIHGEELENDIYLKIVKKLSEFETLLASGQVKGNPKLSALQGELREIEKAIENLINSISSFEPAVIAYINEKVTILDKRKQDLLKAIKEMSVTVLDVGQISMIKEYMSKWHDLSMDDKREICNALIKTIRATAQEVVIDWNF